MIKALISSGLYNSSLPLNITFIFGLLFIFVGNIGLYLSKEYFETKKRPIYIIKETDESEL